MLSKEQLEKIANPGAADIGGTQSPIVTQMAIELLESRAESLSLREQLAELKALDPVAWILNHGDGSSHIEKDKRVADMFEIFAGNKTIPLFTAAKSVGLDVEDITGFMRKAFWRGFESARGTENSNIPEHWKDSKPNLLLALKAKISGD
ncbi:hypothetical protein ACVQFJ_004112 [Yersinia enterocolitica]